MDINASHVKSAVRVVYLQINVSIALTMPPNRLDQISANVIAPFSTIQLQTSANHAILNAKSVKILALTIASHVIRLLI